MTEPTTRHDRGREGSSSEYAHLTPLFGELADAEGDQRTQVRDRLVTGFLPVAQHIAHRYRGRAVPDDDLAQVATVGLINAVDRFDATRGVDFLAFAVPTITGEVRRYFRDSGWLVRLPRRLQELHLAVTRATADLYQDLGRAPRPSEIATRLGVSVDDVYDGIEAAGAYRPESVDRPASTDTDAPVAETLGDDDPALDVLENVVALRPALDRLPARERTILTLRFRDDLTQSEIGEQVGLSQMHVSRLLAKTVDSLREEVIGA